MASKELFYNERIDRVVDENYPNVERYIHEDEVARRIKEAFEAGMNFGNQQCRECCHHCEHNSAEKS